MAQEKFRPALSVAEINYIIALCNLDSRPETAEMGFTIASRLKVFLLKSQLGITGAAFTSSPIRTLDEKLGLDSPEEKRLAAYTKWQLNPAFCTEDELKLAETYRYENGLMTSEQERQHEKL